VAETRYSEVEGDDSEGRILELFAGGMPYAFVAATSLDPLDLRVASNYGTELIRGLLNQTLRALPGGMGEVGDGHHTFQELYDHRRALTAALCKALNLDAWRSRKHHPDDDPMFEGGYFVVGIDLPTGTITYHYKLKYWDDFADVIELEHAPKWDGAAPDDTVTRLLEWVRAVAGARQARS
jgi:hypothetical protein